MPQAECGRWQRMAAMSASRKRLSRSWGTRRRIRAFSRVDRFETHGNLVFLAGSEAWKIKRAVRFPLHGFLHA